MTATQLPIAPLRFNPIAHTRIWGGTQLHDLLNKPAAAGEPDGESWELSALDGNESRITEGALAGSTLPDLARRFRAELLGDVADDELAFPLLIKFLDAALPLSVQVHPKPPAAPGAPSVAVKHEAWYIVHAEPGAEVYIGLRPGVTPDDIAAAANKPVMRDHIQPRHACAGDCFYLPSGTLHALGAGLVVAEVQTPSDTTYRIYDWDRVGADGNPRELHVAQALDNIRYDVADSEIVQARTTIEAAGHSRQRVCHCERFTIDEITADATPFDWRSHQHTFAVWMILNGDARLTGEGFERTARTGDTMLIPAALKQMHVQPGPGFKTLDITPQPRSHAG